MATASGGNLIEFIFALAGALNSFSLSNDDDLARRQRDFDLRGVKGFQLCDCRWHGTGSQFEPRVRCFREGQDRLDGGSARSAG